jgi:hypothetical protein
MPAWVSSALRPAPLDRTMIVRFGGLDVRRGLVQVAG